MTLEEKDLEYWMKRALFLESVLDELREEIKAEHEDVMTRISQLELALGQIYTIIDRVL
jgi:hypothetical protein